MSAEKRVAIYCRVSDAGATDAYGMDSQERECRAYAEAKGWEVVAVFHEWHTGAELFERPELARVREAMRRREFDVLLVHRLDRLARDLNHQGYILSEAEHLGIAWDSATEDVSDPLMGGILRAVIGAFAEMDRLKIVANTSRGKREKVAQGRPLGQGKAPYGLAFRYDADERGRARTVGYIEDPATVETVRRMFAASAAGDSLRKIAAGLEADGILPPNHARTGATRWSASTVRTILRDPIYTGRATAFKTVSGKALSPERGIRTRRHRARPAEERVALPAGTAPVVIDPEVFARVQSRLERNLVQATDFRGSRNPEVGILRRGMAYCGLCGNKLVVLNNRGGPAYSCQGRERTGCPSAVTMSAANADEAVWGWLTEVLSDEDRVRAHLDGLRREDPTAADLAALDRRQAEVERQRAKFVSVIAAMEDPEAAGPIAAQLDALGKQLQGIERDREAILERQAVWQRDQAQMADALAFCRKVAADMKRVTDWADRREIAQALRIRFELYPADHQPRWVASSEVVPDIATSAGSLFNTTACTGGT